MANKTKAEQAEAIRDQEEAGDTLRAILHPGSTVWTLLRHFTPASGRRSIRLIAVGRYPQPDGSPDLVTLDGMVSTFTGWKLDASRGGIITDAMGVDAGYNLVHELGNQLWRHGFDCAGEHCPSNEHEGRDGVPYATRPGEVRHAFGGYALKHLWL